MKLSEFVVEEAVVADLEVSTKQEAIEALVKALVGSGRIQDQDREHIINAIMTREELGSTGIRRGRRAAY